MIKSYNLLQLLVVIGAFWIVLVIFFYPKPDQIVSVADVLFQARHGEFFEMENEREEHQSSGKGAEIDAEAAKLVDELIRKERDKVVVTAVSKTRDRKKIKLATPPNIFNNDSVGEYGYAWKMPEVLPDNIKKLFDEGWKNHQFNQYLSDLISVRRKLLDKRTDHCLAAVPKYSKKLPKTSVIMTFHNEAWSTLLRSVHSVLDRSPEDLIEEIILVDDSSDMG